MLSLSAYRPAFRAWTADNSVLCRGRPPAWPEEQAGAGDDLPDDKGVDPNAFGDPGRCSKQGERCPKPQPDDTEYDAGPTDRAGSCSVYQRRPTMMTSRLLATVASDPALMLTMRLAVPVSGEVANQASAVRRDHGAHVAARLARWNVVAPHREGGQAQFVPVSPPAPDGLGPLCGWVLDRLDQPLTLAQLAAHARCSERTLTRRFRAETGSTPKQWIARTRLDRVRELLESSDVTVDQIAARAGFPTPAALRARVAAELGTTPTAYRRVFGDRTTS